MTIDFGINNQRVLLTGVSGQLGHAIAKKLLDNNAYVVGVDKEISTAINDLAKKYRGCLELYSVDITEDSEIKKIFEIYQSKRIDHLINNAGVSIFTPFWERTEAEFDWVTDVNLKGTFFCIRSYLESVKLHADSNFKGAIVNIASHYGVISPDYRIYTDCLRVNSEIYGATKAGIIQLTKYFSVNASSMGVRVNAVSPGGILNDENPQGADFQKNYAYRCPMGRMANVDEIVDGVIFMISSGSSYINGHNLIIDGGTSAW